MPEETPLVPRIVAREEESATSVTSVSVGASVTLSLTPKERMKFDIGLRLLGEARLLHYLAYLQQLREGTQPGGTTYGF